MLRVAPVLLQSRALAATSLVSRSPENLVHGNRSAERCRAQAPATENREAGYLGLLEDGRHLSLRSLSRSGDAYRGPNLTLHGASAGDLGRWGMRAPNLTLATRRKASPKRSTENPLHFQ